MFVVVVDYRELQLVMGQDGHIWFIMCVLVRNVVGYVRLRASLQQIIDNYSRSAGQNGHLWFIMGVSVRNVVGYVRLCSSLQLIIDNYSWSWVQNGHLWFIMGVLVRNVVGYVRLCSSSQQFIYNYSWLWLFPHQCKSIIRGYGRIFRPSSIFIFVHIDHNYLRESGHSGRYGEDNSTIIRSIIGDFSTIKSHNHG